MQSDASVLRQCPTLTCVGHRICLQSEVLVLRSMPRKVFRRIVQLSMVNATDNAP